MIRAFLLFLSILLHSVPLQAGLLWSRNTQENECEPPFKRIRKAPVIKTNHEATKLLIAVVKKGNLTAELLNELLAHGADLHCSRHLLDYAINALFLEDTESESRSYEAIEVLLQHGINPNVGNFIFTLPHVLVTGKYKKDLSDRQKEESQKIAWEILKIYFTNSFDISSSTQLIILKTILLALTIALEESYCCCLDYATDKWVMKVIMGLLLYSNTAEQEKLDKQELSDLIAYVHKKKLEFYEKYRGVGQYKVMSDGADVFEEIHKLLLAYLDQNYEKI